MDGTRPVRIHAIPGEIARLPEITFKLKRCFYNILRDGYYFLIEFDDDDDAGSSFNNLFHESPGISNNEINKKI